MAWSSPPVTNTTFPLPAQQSAQHQRLALAIKAIMHYASNRAKASCCHGVCVCVWLVEIPHSVVFWIKFY